MEPRQFAVSFSPQPETYRVVLDLLGSPEVRFTPHDELLRRIAQATDSKQDLQLPNSLTPYQFRATLVAASGLLRNVLHGIGSSPRDPDEIIDQHLRDVSDYGTIAVAISVDPQAFQGIVSVAHPLTPSSPDFDLPSAAIRRNETGKQTEWGISDQPGGLTRMLRPEIPGYGEYLAYAGIIPQTLTSIDQASPLPTRTTSLHFLLRN